jgi:hypothetical protein
MNLDKIIELLSHLGPHELLIGGAVVAGIVLLLLLVFKIGKFLTRLLLFLIAIGLLAGAWWWHTHR